MDLTGFSGILRLVNRSFAPIKFRRVVRARISLKMLEKCLDNDTKKKNPIMLKLIFLAGGWFFSLLMQNPMMSN